MKFEEVLPALRAGKIVRRVDGIAIQYSDEALWFGAHAASLSGRSLMADDWEVVEQPSPFHFADKKMNWRDACLYADNKGMRLPTSDELHVLVRDGYIKGESGWAWTCNTVSSNASYAWSVGLYVGSAFLNDKAVTGRVVCVPTAFDLREFVKGVGK